MKTLLIAIFSAIVFVTVISAIQAPINAQAPLSVEIQPADSNAEYARKFAEFDANMKKKKEDDLKLVIQTYLANICDLSFTSLKDGTTVNAPDWFIARIKGYSCREKKVLTRLAYYESNFNPEAVNGWFYGLYQIGQGDTKDTCIRNGRYDSDEDCALFLYNYNKYSQFETVATYADSFNF